MAYPRKYRDKLTTAINIERKKKEILDILGIELTYATNVGADSLIQDRVKTGKTSRDVAEMWYDLHRDEGTCLRNYIQSLDKASEYIEEIREENKKQVAHDNEKIYVYDELDQIYREISRVKYENEKWRYKRAAKPKITDDDEEDNS